ncbi:MAG: prepilin-type N-terminal cleavage/methylation domain-containing protein [Verrucomicrobiales bacterium]|jgi:uncharacterized protein (TIGR02598 family)|nr:prepilin-type N-terminal cleavage/methylation domain-containing protein [Verrucomicrobiales bacterium]
MNRHRQPPARRPRRGFSLVEIVVAMAIVTFALTAVFGLVALALQSTRSSAADDVVAFMSQSLSTQYRQQKYTGNGATNNNDDPNNFFAPGGTALVFYRYFDAQGTPFCDADGVPIEDETESIPVADGERAVVYVCEISIRENPALDQILTDSGARFSGTVTVSSQIRQLQFRFFRVHGKDDTATGGNRKPVAVIVSGLAKFDDPL